MDQIHLTELLPESFVQPFSVQMKETMSSKLNGGSELETSINWNSTLNVELQLKLHSVGATSTKDIGFIVQMNNSYTVNVQYASKNGGRNVQLSHHHNYAMHRHTKQLTSLNTGLRCAVVHSKLCVPFDVSTNLEYYIDSNLEGSGVYKGSTDGAFRIHTGVSTRNLATTYQFHKSNENFSHGVSTSSVTGDASGLFKVAVSAVLDVKFPAQLNSYVPKISKMPNYLMKWFDVTHSYHTGPNLEFQVKVPLQYSAKFDRCSKDCHNSSATTHVTETIGVIDIESTVIGFKLNQTSRARNILVTNSYCIPGASKEDCHYYCDCPDGSISMKKQKHKNKEQCDCNYCKKHTPGCPCTCPDGSKGEFENSKCSCPCECSPGLFGKLVDGTCSCPCTCNNCRESYQVNGKCVCPMDICPVCDSGYEAVWHDCVCQCREKLPKCGLPAACVFGRRGEQCDQPDCEPCSIETDGGLLECSGNGRCVTSSTSCSSQCVCGARWTGVCCDRRIPRNLGGDPHLQTLDGIPYDYHGIGEFWDCKDQDNDFGIQVRFFGFRQASLIGAAALKVGQSVLTVTTPTSANESSLPIVRLDGSMLSIQNGTKEMLGNDTIILEVTVSKVDNGGAVALIALEFANGISITTDVRYSKTMERLFLNVRTSLIARSRGRTSGLCGFMDDDNANDFTTSNGNILSNSTSDIITFAESWRINQSFNGSGLAESWSWTKSNFHAEDEMDPSYTDPSLYNPSYEIKNISSQELQIARETCQRKGLAGIMLQECIYDVAITNDTSFAEQEVYQTGCKNQCNGKGRCVNATCACFSGWSGDECNIGHCGNCSKGSCDSGFCRCDVGWEGIACDIKATCLYVNNCTDEMHGVCFTTNKCKCNDGFIGADCSIVPTCVNVSDCSSNGVCVDYDVCKCDRGWKGSSCSNFSCEAKGRCHGNGDCVGYDICKCRSGWRGESCSLPDCAQVNQCSGHGSCLAPNQCLCENGYRGSGCNESVECGKLDNCTSHGQCVTTASNDTYTTACRCYYGYSGANCSVFDCTAMNNCSQHGSCVEPNLCDCDMGYTGDECSVFSCEQQDYCSGNGNCTGFDNCTCHDGYSGDNCDQGTCTNVGNCSIHGYCIGPDICKCYIGYEGVNCSTPIGNNTCAPTFTDTNLTTSITEDTAVGTMLSYSENKTLNATDDDLGRNGQIQYSLSGGNDKFSIDSKTGNVYVAGLIDYEELVTKTIALTITATDSGSKPKYATAKVYVAIQDVNDNSPVFTAGKSSIEIDAQNSADKVIGTYSATDKDSGVFSEVTYLITPSSDPNGQFSMNATTGQLLLKGKPQLAEYTIIVIAQDGGIPARLAQTTVHITFTGQIIPEPLSPVTIGLPNIIIVHAKICGPGTYVNLATDDCDNCPTGTWKNTTDYSIGCIPCDEGEITTNTGQNSSSSCFLDCPSGQAYDDITKTCQNCSIGYFRNQSESTSCEMCPPHLITEDVATVSRHGCTLGNCTEGYQPKQNEKTECEPCPVGTFANRKWLKKCQSCPLDYTTDGAGATRVNECKPANGINVNITMEFRVLSVEYNTKYADFKSAEFEEVRSETIPFLVKKFELIPGFADVKVTKIRIGSIIISYNTVVVANSVSLALEALTPTYKSIALDAKLGEYILDDNHYRIEVKNNTMPPKDKLPINSESSASDMNTIYIIIGSVCGVLLLLIIIVVLVACSKVSKRKPRSVSPYKVDENDGQLSTELYTNVHVINNGRNLAQDQPISTYM